MRFLRILPTLISVLLLGAHFLRTGNIAIVLMVLASPLLLRVRPPFGGYAMKVFLVFATIEWIRTSVVLFQMREALGEPWIRMVVILGSVAAFTAGSALLIRVRPLPEPSAE